MPYLINLKIVLNFWQFKLNELIVVGTVNVADKSNTHSKLIMVPFILTDSGNAFWSLVVRCNQQWHLGGSEVVIHLLMLYFTVWV